MALKFPARGEEFAALQNLSRRKKIFLAVSAVLVLFPMLVFVAGYFYIQTASFRSFALKKTVEQVEQATGSRASIGNLDFSLSTLTAHLYDITLQGAPSSEKPLAHLDELTVKVAITSLWKGDFNIREIVLDRPVVNVLVDRQGHNNFPTPPKSQSSSNSSVFDLAIGHLAVNDGIVNYNDRSIPMDANVNQFATDIRFDPANKSYDGNLSYENGTIAYGDFKPMPHALNAKFAASASGADLSELNLKVLSSTLSAKASLTNYSSPNASGSYRLVLNLEDAERFLPGYKLRGDATLDGNFHYADAPGKPAIQNAAADGRLTAHELAVASPDGQAALRNLDGRFHLAQAELRVDRLFAELFGGTFEGRGKVTQLDGTPSSDIKADLHGIDLALIQAALPKKQRPQITLVGRMDGSVAAVMAGGADSLRAKSDLKLQSSAQPTPKQMPLNGVLHAEYAGKDGTLTLRQSSLSFPALEARADGRISSHSSLQFEVNASDLHRLAQLAQQFAPGQKPLPVIAGSAKIAGTVTGSMKQPQIAASVTTKNLEVQGAQWQQASFNVKASPSRAVVTEGKLVSAKLGAADFSASVDLRNWAYQPTSPLTATFVTRHDLSIADLQHLAGFEYPVSGALSADVNLRGTQLEPQLEGRLAVVHAEAWEQPIQSLAVNFHTLQGSVVTTSDVVTPAGSANANLTFNPKTKAYELSLRAPAVVLDRVQALKLKLPTIEGTLKIEADGKGTLDDPQLKASAEIPQLSVSGQRASGIKASANVANKKADFTLVSDLAQTSVRGKGHIDLVGDYPADISVDTGIVPLAAAIAASGSTVPEGFEGQTELHASLKGPLKKKEEVQAQVTIPSFNARYQTIELAAAGPIHIDYANNIVTLQPAEIRGTDTSVKFQGALPLSGSSKATLSAQGTIDARIAKLASPDLQSSGKVLLDVHASRSSGNPQLAGQIKLQDIAVEQVGAPLGVSHLNGVLDLNGDRVQLTGISGDVGGGKVELGGSFAYRPAPQFDVALNGKGIRLRYPEGLRTLLESNLTWAGDMQRSLISGRVLISQLSFTPDFDLSSFAGQFGGVSVPSQPGFADNIRLQIAVQSQDNLNARSSQVSIEGTADLHVIGTAADPVITGRADLNSGELFYRNVRYQLEHGVISFDSPNETHPNLNVAVSTTVEQYNLTLNLRGPIESLTTSYVSDPPLATADIINLIALGKTTSESAASSQSTDSMVASQAASQLSSGVQKLAGISSLQIDPLIGGNNQNPSARLALQQRVTKNFLFTFSTDVSQPGQEIVQGDYRINKRWSVSVERDQLGGVSVDGRLHTRF